MHFSPDGGQRQRLSFMKAVGFCVGYPTRCTQQREQGFTAALAQVRVLPEIEPFFHGVGFAIIGPQSLITHWRGSCGRVVAGPAAAGAGHDLRRLGVGC